jgi:hypothetical protein
MIDVSIIKQVYSGKPGCGCGCRGQYWTDQRNINRVVNAMNKLGNIKILDAPGETIFSVELPNRYYWAYTRDD